MKHEDKKPHDKQVHTQDAGNGNPPPKKPPVAPQSEPETFSTMSDSPEEDPDAGNGNPPPKKP